MLTPGQHGVAVPEGSEQPPVLVDDKDELTTRLVDGREGVLQGRFGSDERLFPVGHGRTSALDGIVDVVVTACGQTVSILEEQCQEIWCPVA